VKSKVQFRLCVFVLGAFLFSISPAMWAQETTSLRGTVVDPSNAAIPNATVHLINTETSFERQETTDAQGSFVFVQILPGLYRLQVDAPGFARYEQSGIQLLVNSPATLNVRMKLGQQQQTVEVTERAPLINTTDASTGSTMSGNEIGALPLEGRNVVQLLSLQPGVVYTSDRSDIDTNFDTRGGAVNGERSDQSNVTLDGMDVNDQGGGAAFTSVLPITVDSVEEFRVTTSNYGADQGRSAGAQVALVTRGGTNKFHGSAYEFNRSGIGEANDYFIKNAEETSDQPNVPPHLVRNIFGGSVGGPIKKDRLFFFLNYEGHRIDQASSQEREIPSETLRDGIIQYQCANPSACPGSSVTGQSGNSYTIQPGYYALGYVGGTSQLAALDPLGIGPSSTVMSYFQTYPAPNDFTIGDGVNFVGYRFAAPQVESDDWLIGRFDYKLNSSGTQTLFWRGSGRDDNIGGAPFLPGTAPESTIIDRSKGMVAGYTAVLRPNLVNNFRYGFTRQSIVDLGDSSQAWIYIRDLDQGITRTESFNFPVHNFMENLTWTKGQHTLSFGANLMVVLNNAFSQTNSFSDGVANAAWLNTGGFAGRDSPFNPSCANDFQTPNSCIGPTYPDVDQGFFQNYDFPLIGLLGMVSQVDAQYNYRLSPSGAGTPIDQGGTVPRHFRLDDYDFFVQDSWKVKSNLTLNFGLRYELMSPPWETAGQEVAPTMNLGQWLAERATDGAEGIPSNQVPDISFGLAGSANNKPNLWPWEKKNFAPRVSFAWTPEPTFGWMRKLFGEKDNTVIRGGFGMYYDHFGEGMLSTFDAAGSFGLSTTLTNSAQTESASSSPRLTSLNTIPLLDNNNNPIFTPAPPAQFPEMFPQGNFCICWGLDSSIKTPYSYAIDLSVARELPHNMSLEVGYVGHMGRHLLAQEDLAEPLNLKDPASGITYFQAADAMSVLGRANTPVSQVTSSTIGPTGAYWQDLMAPLASGDQYNPGNTTYGPGCGGPTTDVVQAVYAAYLCNAFNETTALFFLDVAGMPGTIGSSSGGAPANFYYSKFGPFAWYNDQYSSLYAWRSISNSIYGALEVTFRKQFSQGLAFNFNYTYGHSEDIASDAERVGEWGGLGGQVINTWSPNQLWADSDFDLRHQVNASWNWNIPVGTGRAFGSGMGKGADAVLGGWQLSGVTRWSSGFPVNVGTCYCFETNWQLTGEAIETTPTSTGRTLVNEPVNGGYFQNIFPGGTDAANNFAVPLPGFSGARNQIRGDGYFGTDFELGKVWKMPYNENHQLRFTWDVFNAFNVNRFDVQTASLGIGSANTFGNYTHLLTNPRIMQFGLRYSF